MKEKLCEFISWLEEPETGEVVFLKAEDLEDKVIRKRLAGSQDNDFLGHGAIKAAYPNLERGYLDRENRTFWDGKMPKPIVEAWNNGGLDGMLKHLQRDDLIFILQNAPREFSLWAIKQRYDSNFEGMKKDGDETLRLARYLVNWDFKGMEGDTHLSISIAGSEAILDQELIKKCSIELPNMKCDNPWRTRMAWDLRAKNFERMREDEYWTNRLIGYTMDPAFDISKMQRPQIALAA